MDYICYQFTESAIVFGPICSLQDRTGANTLYTRTDSIHLLDPDFGKFLPEGYHMKYFFVLTSAKADQRKENKNANSANGLIQQLFWRPSRITAIYFAHHGTLLVHLTEAETYYL